ncbi:MAG: cation diffusion facilitator family transporter [Bacillota bacterium]
MTQHQGHQQGRDHSREGNQKGLAIALVITFGIMLLEFFGGIFTNSLALLSDSGHMLSDVSSLLLSLIAIWLALRPPSPRKTYGYYRFEILAALFNGITLFVIAGFIIREAYQRLFAPPLVSSGTMIVIALIGLLANASSALVLLRKADVKENVNVRSAYVHIIGDTLGSIGTIIAGILIYVFSWFIADPIISVIVALLILKSAWGVINHSVHVLLEGAPETIDFTEVKNTLTGINGVIDIHDLHVWTITSGFDSLSCHLQIRDNADGQAILQETVKKIEEKFKITHTTIQIENCQFHHTPGCC